MAGHNLSVINRARHGLAVKQRQERRALTSQRPRLGVKRQSFKSWLRERGRDYQADCWRYRNRAIPSALRSSPPAANLADAQTAYAVHRQEILRQQNVRSAALTAGMALFGKTWTAPPRSLSRQDAWVALLMRADGHSREAVTDAIWRSAPELRREEKRDWRRYATRTAAYAFGLAGDMALAKMPRMKPKPIETPPPPMESVQIEPEPQRKAPRLRMR